MASYWRNGMQLGLLLIDISMLVYANNAISSYTFAKTYYNYTSIQGQEKVGTIIPVFIPMLMNLPYLPMDQWTCARAEPQRAVCFVGFPPPDLLRYQNSISIMEGRRLAAANRQLGPRSGKKYHDDGDFP